MSILKLTAEYRNGRTVISDCEFTAPLKVSQPFYRNGYTEVMMMTASAGLLDGDYYDIEITVRKNARLKFTGQSYTKAFKANEKGAYQRVRITVEKGSVFFYEPYPVIPFAGSIFSSNTEIYLDSGCKYAMTDILSSGRAAMNERLEFKHLRTRTAIYIDGKMKFLDNQRLTPNSADLSGTGFFEGYSHTGFLYAYGLSGIKLCEYGDTESAVSCAAEGECIRTFSNSADNICKMYKNIQETYIQGSMHI